jgi:AraC-like DNA-binding protein
MSTPASSVPAGPPAAGSVPAHPPAAASVPAHLPAEFVTADPEQAHEFLVKAYVDNTMRIRGAQEGFRMRHHYRAADRFSIGTLRHSMAVEHHADPLGYLLVGRVLGGRIERETAGETVRAAVGDVFVVADPAQPYVVRWDDVDLELTRVDSTLLAAVGGGAEGRPVRLAGLRPTDPAAGRRLAGVLDWAATGVFANPEAAASPLVTGGAGRLLAAIILTTFPHVAAVPSPADRADATPALLRRATEHIEAYAHTDIGLAEVAAAVGASPRAVRLAFRAHWGTTPGEHLRRERLRRAHLDLLDADPTRGDTVVAVATRWGFAHQGRFAAEYRRAYGESPARTLRR